MSRILITGGGGMIDNETSKMLSENGYKVRIIDFKIFEFNQKK